MNAELVKAWAEVIKAAVYGAGVLGGLAIVWRSIDKLFKSGNPFRVSVGKLLQIAVQPAGKTEPPPSPAAASSDAALVANAADLVGAPAMGAVQPTADQEADLPSIASDAAIPSDYIYLVHTSFLRLDKQAEFKARTKVASPHYDIRVKTESYYRGAMDRVAYVEYFLHKAFPDPIQSRYHKEDGFELKEIANGEFVLAAKVYLKDRREALILQRYITLWPSGPRI